MEHTNCPRISVVTPSFNHGQYLKECIDSVLSQNYPNLEYIIMDGGSSDNSVEIIKRYEKHLKFWQSQPDGGQYAAINEAFKRTTGEIMTWLNSDDKFHTNAFKIVASIFKHRKDVEWITGRPNVLNDHLQRLYDTPLVFWSRERYLRKDYKFIQQEGTFWRRSLWEKAGATLQTDLCLAGDLELWARFFRHAQLYSVDASIAIYRVHLINRAQVLMNIYIDEAEKVLDREIQLFKSGKNKELLPAPKPILHYEIKKIMSHDNYGMEFVSQGGVVMDSPEKIYQGIQPLINIDNPEMGICALERLLESFPDYGLAHNDIGVLYFNQGNKDKALKHYEKAAELLPENITFQRKLANFYFFELGRMEEALKIYVDILASNPKDIETLHTMGQVCMALEKYDDAKDFYDCVLAIEPWNDHARKFLDHLKHGKAI